MESSQPNWAWISQRQLNIALKCLYLARRPLGYCSFQNILTNPVISQIDTLSYIISCCSSAITINSTTTTPKCTLHSVLFLLNRTDLAVVGSPRRVFQRSFQCNWFWLQIINNRGGNQKGMSKAFGKVVQQSR